MAVLVALEWTQGAPHSFCLNEFASRNMLFILPTCDTSHFERSPLNDVAPWNMPDTSFTLDTSHFEMSALNNFASENMRLISVTLDTPHSPISPCGPLEQSPFGKRLRHALTALLSSTLDRGNNAKVSRVRGRLCECVRHVAVLGTGGRVF